MTRPNPNSSKFGQHWMHTQKTIFILSCLKLIKLHVSFTSHIQRELAPTGVGRNYYWFNKDILCRVTTHVI